jgi:hypothetical protein
MRKLPFVRLIESGTDAASLIISWIINKSKLRGADTNLGDTLPADTDTLNAPIYQLQRNIETIYDLTAISGLRQNAPIENRLTYFSTDLNIPIWWDSSIGLWVNANGIPLAFGLMIRSSDGRAIISSDGLSIASTE